nr:type-F conjugative transfer system secretin TraK [Cupriavidus malaysiensis]
MPPGAKQSAKPTVIRTRPGMTEIVTIASQYPNRIATPFAKPNVIDQQDVEFKIVGNSVYVSAMSERPVAIFLSDVDNPAAVISLTLVPQNVPQQTITLELDVAGKTPGAASEETGRESEYIVNLRTLLRTVARGGTPRGFTLEELSIPMAVSNGIQVVPQTRYSGNKYDIFRYRLTNANAASVTLSEEAFESKGVRAVALFPRLQLPPGGETDVLIVADKIDAEE